MRNRIVAVACGIMLAVLGLPAVPAAAESGITCANLYAADRPQPGDPDVLARSCIFWNDLPAVLGSGATLLKWPESVGRYTAKFAVLVQGYSSTPYCIYMIPRGYNIEHHNC